MQPRILVVDDDKAVRSALRVNLSKAGYDVQLMATAEEALELLRAEPFDVVLTDVKMPGVGGLHLLDAIKERWPDVQVVVMTGQGSVEDAVRAMKAGAADYIIKPVSRDELLVILERTWQARALTREVTNLRKELADQFGFENIIGRTPKMRDAYKLVDAVADSSALVLLTGPTGTGKELFAHAIHYRSDRANSPFVQVNCAAIPEGLLESELFGHEKGAFTGALRQHRGKFEQADGGSLLLDEIGDIPLSTQVKLLRVLENGTFQRVGGDRTLTADVRVIAATNRNLREDVREGRFREDLYYRLNVFHIPIPALSERMEDIPLLAQYFVNKFSSLHSKPANRLSPRATEMLMQHDWPGNVRELEHAIERAVILSRTEEIADIDIPAPLATTSNGDTPVLGARSLPEALGDIERDLIVEALRLEDGVQARAARKLGVSRSNLNYRINKLGISVRSVVDP